MKIIDLIESSLYYDGKVPESINTVKIYKNPSKKFIDNMFERYDIRGFVSIKDLYIWNSDAAIHNNIYKVLPQDTYARIKLTGYSVIARHVIKGYIPDKKEIDLIINSIQIKRLYGNNPIIETQNKFEEPIPFDYEEYFSIDAVALFLLREYAYKIKDTNQVLNLITKESKLPKFYGFSSIVDESIAEFGEKNLVNKIIENFEKYIEIIEKEKDE